MPRNGSGVYSKPSGTTAVPNTTIESSMFNTLVDDIVTDLNAARPITAGGTGGTSVTTAQTALGLLIGTDVQAYNANLASLSGLTLAADKMLYSTGPETFALASLTSAGRAILDDADAAAQRTTLGLGSAAVKNVTDDEDLSTDPENIPTRGNVAANIKLSLEYQSSAQTLTSGGLLTLAHGLGAAPKIIQTYIKCAVADIGYSVGDQVFVEMAASTAATTRVSSIFFDDTNIYVRFSDAANVFLLANKATGVGSVITNASWEFYVRAFA